MMAKIPTPEESARHMLTIFKEKGVRPGEMLMPHSFMASSSWTTDDLAHGMKFAVGNGWVEFTEGNYFLTQAGFKEM